MNAEYVLRGQYLKVGKKIQPLCKTHTWRGADDLIPCYTSCNVQHTYMNLPALNHGANIYYSTCSIPTCAFLINRENVAFIMGEAAAVQDIPHLFFNYLCGDFFLICPMLSVFISIVTQPVKRNKHNKPVFYLNKDTFDGLFISIS